MSGDEALLPSAPTAASAVAPVRSTPRVGAPSDELTEPSEQSDLAVSRRDAVSERGFGESSATPYAEPPPSDAADADATDAAAGVRGGR